MIIIRTAEDMARALDSPLHPAVKQRLRAQAERLAEYEGFTLADLAMFVVVQPGDTLDDLERKVALRLVADGQFTLSPEFADRDGDWLEVTFILSDDGFGLVLIVELCEATDPTLLAACQKLIGDSDRVTYG